MRLRFIFAALAAFLFVSPACAAGQYGDWAAIVVAADYRAHSGADSEVFDNARRDISADLVAIGFTPTNILQFSVRPERYPSQQPRQTNPNTIGASLWDLSNRTGGGCFAYFTSHGNTDGISMGDEILPPQKMNQMITNACGDRPTVVIVSACFSGVFVPVLQAPNRFVMTAARPDRTSFGCGEQERYTFFDNCVVQNFLGAGDFPDLATKVKACVAAREKQDKIAYPSEPQISIGATVAAQLPRWK
ncbi:MAG TPA: C13 family peptidase [Rhizomicrobium sp.]|nr:C13 family peptidase [Rhizomicrobium sp.]